MSAEAHVNYGSARAILLTNDDGIHPDKSLILSLASALVVNGHNVVVVAPGRNNSACGQRITLGKALTLRRHPRYENQFGSVEPNGAPKGELRVFSVDKGTPADCIFIAIEPKTGLVAKLGFYPCLTLSGVNYGQNMGSDILYSGTFAGARQSAMYGVPAIASSLDLHLGTSSSTSCKQSCDRAITATVELAESALKVLPKVPLDFGRRNPEAGISTNVIARDETQSLDERTRDAFARGDLVLNLNIPKAWNAEYEMTRLDCLLYRGVVQLEYVPNGKDGHPEETLAIKMRSSGADQMHSKGSDLTAVERGRASVTAVGTWPSPHPLALPGQLMEESVRNGLGWIPHVSAKLQKEILHNF
ncbi:5'-nucleotidase SurE [Gracilariopsis chorda]|uniref:5'-nucleotidase SurE n=1 Tax=Gracilariopsis chorda TaxID=448386 RepID=A0A2V3J1E2_9FLOR|nr:5'-nucleotidase SurE [Gracilariopsis chorda]|eukprot:PXF48133.1 5'-nucleotidase SurE [Gracilariopsis chorda]